MQLLRRQVMTAIAQGGTASKTVSGEKVEAADVKETSRHHAVNGVSPSGPGKPLHLLYGSGLHHINVRVRDIDKAIDFYMEAFSFSLLFRWDGVEGLHDGSVYFRNNLQGAHLDMGDGQVLELIPAPKNAVPPGERASSFNHIGLRVSDLEETYDQALAAGAKPYPIRDGSGGVWDGPTTIKLKARPPFKRSFVVRAAHVVGPDDEIIELFEA